ncbi:MAG: thiamine phosphate synthase [Planctomycetota bacterium]
MNRLLRRLRSVLITDGVGDQDRIETVVAAALAGGFSAVQVREPKLTARQQAALCERLWPRVAAHDALLLVNDRVDVAALACAHGVHLGFRSLAPEPARAILGREKLVGFSAHDEAELSWATAQGVDYVILAPVFQTASKPGARALGIDRTRALVAAAKVPVILLGGLNEHTLEDAMTVGAHGHAFLSAVCQAQDPEAAARRLLEVAAR